MKILHVISSTDPKIGGPIEGMKQLYSQYSKLGVTAEVLCSDAPGMPWHSGHGLPKVHALGPALNGYGYNSNLLSWLRKNVAHYDAVIVDGIWQYHSLAVRKALANSNVPYFVFTHGMLDPWFKKTYPLKHLKKWLYWPWAEYRVLRDANAVIFTCEEEKILARESFWLYRATEAVTSYGTSSPPSNTKELADRFLAVYPELQEKRIILFLSRIHEKKGCDLLLKAFSQVAAQDNRLHLVMAGPDQTGWASILKEQAVTLGIANRISWPGMLQGDDKWGAFNAAEVFCLPSHQENFGIVVAEALACGKPVLISNKVNIWREIESDSAGFTDNDDVDGTVRNLQRWLALDPVAYIAMSDRAKECFTHRFHVRSAAERLVEIIRQYR